MLVLLLACAPKVTDTVAPTCTSGFELHTDGLCYQTGTTSNPDTADPVTTLLDSLPSCTPLAARTGIDLAKGCADGVCTGMTYSQVNGVLGTQATLYPNSPGWLFAVWSDGIAAWFTDADGDGQPDPTYAITRVDVFPPYAGATADGLGVGLGLRCYVDVLGNPTEVVYQPNTSGDRFRPVMLNYAAQYLDVWDDRDPNGNAIPDRVSDILYLFGGG